MKKLFLLGALLFMVSSSVFAVGALSIDGAVSNTSINPILEACKKKLGPNASDFAIKNCVNSGAIQKVKKEFKEEKQVISQEKKEILDQKKEIEKKVQIQTTEARRVIQAERMEFREEVQNEREDFAEKMKNAETDEERTQIRKEAEMRKGELQDEAEVKRAEIKEEREKRLVEIRNKRIIFAKQKLENTLRKLKAYENKATKINERVKERLEILKEKGYDISNLEEKRVRGEEYIEKIRAKIVDLAGKIESFDPQSTDKEELKKIFEEVRAVYKSVREDFKQYFLNVREIMKELRELIRVNRSEVDSDDTDNDDDDDNDGEENEDGEA
ncbi:MAG: hypothetical protein KAI16_00655 [Candidatus Pacebacteria bacterium]|nr:hypothetical protein [Candidatus Paceibacterota bacterium]